MTSLSKNVLLIRQFVYSEKNNYSICVHLQPMAPSRPPAPILFAQHIKQRQSDDVITNFYTKVD